MWAATVRQSCEFAIPGCVRCTAATIAWAEESKRILYEGITGELRLSFRSHLWMCAFISTAAGAFEGFAGGGAVNRRAGGAGEYRDSICN
jgi:hypothetical protein